MIRSNNPSFSCEWRLPQTRVPGLRFDDRVGELHRFFFRLLQRYRFVHREIRIEAAAFSPRAEKSVEYFAERLAKQVVGICVAGREGIVAFDEITQDLIFFIFRSRS